MKSRRKIFVVSIILLSLIIIALLVYDLKNAEPSNGFTELYFVGELPKEIKINADYNFSFAIRNLENKGMAYNYSVLLKSDMITSQVVNLRDNEALIINQTFKVENKEYELIPIIIRLTNKGQEIHFWVKLK